MAADSASKESTLDSTPNAREGIEADWSPYTVWRTKVMQSGEAAPAEEQSHDESWSPFKVWESRIRNG